MTARMATSRGVCLKGSRQHKEMKADVQLLLECLNCQESDPDAMKQSLLAISALCTSNDAVKDILRDEGGLHQMLKILKTTDSEEVQEVTMYTLGCSIENSVYSQKQLATDPVFNFLCKLLKRTQVKPRLHQTACFLLLAIVTNNSLGQTAIRTSGCLQVLLQIFRACPADQDEPRRDLGDQQWFEDMDSRNADVWAAATSAICGCLNNPQNDENQRLCAAVFPHAFILLQQNNIKIAKPIVSLIGLAAANNYHNQMRVKTAGGVKVLMSLLHRSVNRIQQPEYCTLAACITSTIDIFISDNKQIAEECGKLGMVALVVKLLHSEKYTAQTVLRLVVTLSHLIDCSVVHRKQFVDAGGLTFLIGMLTDCEDSELSRAIKYVLHNCVTVARDIDQAAGKSQVDKTLPGACTSDCDVYPTSPVHINHIILQKLNALEKTLLTEDPEPLQCRPPAVSPNNDVLQARDHHSPVPKTAGHTRQDALANRLQKELQKERQLRQSMEIKANDMQKELRKRKQAEHAEALTRELLRQRNSPHSSQYKDKGDGSEAKGDSESSSQSLSSASSPDDQNITQRLRKRETPRVSATKQSRRSHRSAGHTGRAIKDKKDKTMLETKASKTRTKRNTVEAELDKSDCTKNRENIKQKSEHRSQSKMGNTLVEKDAAKYEKRRSEEAVGHPGTPRNTASVGLQTHELTEHDVSSTDPPVKNIATTFHSPRSVSIGVQTPDLMTGVAAFAQQRRTGEPQKWQEQQKQQHQQIEKQLQPEQHSSLSVPSSSQSTNTSPMCESSHRNECQGVSSLCADSEGVYCQSLPTFENSCVTPGEHTPWSHHSFTCPSTTTGVFSSRSARKGVLSFSRTNQNTPQQGIGTKTPLNDPYFAVSSFYPSTKCHSTQGTPFSCKRRQAFKQAQSRLLSPSMRLTPISSRQISKSFQSVYTQRKGHHHREETVPPSPCPSEFDGTLIARANEQMNHSHAEVGSSCGQGGLQATPVSAIHPARFYQPNKCRAPPSACSLKRILANNLASPPYQSAGKLPNAEGDGPLQQHSDAGEESDIESIEGSTCTKSVASDRVLRERLGNTKCPGCQQPAVIDGPLLNSRTFNMAIETSGFTCKYHRFIRQQERQCIATQLNTARENSQSGRLLKCNFANLSPHAKSNEDVYSLASTPSNGSFEALSPPCPDTGVPTPLLSKWQSNSSKRRPRVPYTQEEEATLLEAVSKEGTVWPYILAKYQFHPSRRATDLKDKYKQLKSKLKKAQEGTPPVQQKRKPFSMAEERRLRRGVKLYGYNWKVISAAFRFAPGRGPKDLRDKWHGMHRGK